jgi:hypothetical protein
MNIQDLPLPLRLRNALLKAGFKTDDDLREWLAVGPITGEPGETIPGVGATGLQQLVDWAAEPPPREAATPVAEASTPEEDIAKGAKRHEVAQMVDHAMRGGLDQLGRWGHDVAMSRAAAEVKPWTTTMSGPAARNTLILQLEADIQARITALIPTIKALPHVKELGVEVSAETVGRMALIRGLDALERAHKGGNQAKTGENRAESTENRDDSPILAPPDDAEVLDTPEGWTKVGPSEAIPVPEAVLHDYYTQNGWNRYWGRVDDQVIYFYWSPEKRLQDLRPFPGTDKSGRRMAEQATPWGPGHVVPTKWANS